MTRIGQYEILAKIASGGMGTVYRAVHVPLHREVALKVLLPSLSEDVTALARFQREAQAASRLRHPNIVEVYDLGRADGQDYMAMEYVPGGSLQQKLREMVIEGNVMSEEEALRLLRPVASALNYAHEQGLIHRDVKPSNILLRADGVPVLADFGIVLAMTATRLTANVSSIGTPEYMSPEQGRGAAVDGRSDLYSLGIVLYEVLAGETPFRADTPVAIVYKHIKEPLPPLARTDISLLTRRLIEKVTAKDPNDRFQTGADMVRAIDQALAALQSGGRWKPGRASAKTSPRPASRQEGASAEPVRQIRTHRWQIAGMAFLLVCIALAVVLILSGQVQPAAQPIAPVPSTASPVSATEIPQPTHTPVIAATATLLLEATDTAAPAPSDTPAGVVVSLGPMGDLQELSSQPVGTVWQLAWSPDNTMLAAALSKDALVELYSVPDLKQVAQCTGHAGGMRSVAFSPDGSMLASGASDNTARIWKLDTAKCTPLYVLPHKKTVVSVVFQPTSQALIATGSDDGIISLWDARSGKQVRSWSGDPVSIPALAFSPDGQTLISGGSDALIHIWSLDGKEVRQFKGHTGWVWDIAVSADGAMLASAGTGNLFNQAVPPDNTARLWRVRDSQPLQELPSGSHYVLSVNFTHDGQYLAAGSRYDSAPTSVRNLRFWRVSDGQLMGEGPLTDAVTSLRFSPDGSMLAVGTSRSQPWGAQKVGGLYLYRLR